MFKVGYFYDIFAFRVITLLLLVVTDRHCATAYRSHLQRLSSPLRNSSTVLPLNTETVGYIETSITTIQTCLTFQIGEDFICTAVEV
jgi:hypothetical protein